ncbi:primosomal protein DnaI [Enterococcus sp. AZ150]|uniref:Primosomal protein DnaI n=1 Tax=Enterococcus sulfureus ATCC 49903 TaxID=1140003 RepID=S0L852_9ENTE|nr:primosomal protein DnaI [Enterococcus sulfureus]EOT47681.1 primosomal protein DnaI [Enterococcus sulfureus ATCC 49903]EOT83898.1 primosomal protein DnaI [Enterococcus sulfureus ATCC 49903]
MEDLGKSMQRKMDQNNYRARYQEMMQEVLQNEEVKQFLEDHQQELTQQDIQKSFAKLYEFVQEKQKFLTDDKNMIAPGYEPKLTMNFHFIDVTYVPTTALLEKEHQQEVKARIHTLHMPKDIQDASIEHYERTTGRSQAWLGAVDFIESYLADPKAFHKGLYLVGPFGVGKTYLLGAIARELAEAGKQTTLVHFPTFASDMKQAIGKDQVGEKLDAVKRTPILMIDDIGADSMSSWIRDEVFGIILQHRMQEQLPTFFSSNFSVEELEAHLTVSQRGDVEPLKSKRIMERIRYLVKEIEVTGPNRRLGEQ